MDNKKLISFRVDSDVRDLFKIKCIENSVTMTETFENFMIYYIKESGKNFDN